MSVNSNNFDITEGVVGVSYINVHLDRKLKEININYNVNYDEFH